MTMVSLASTMCSFIDCFMMVGGCLTADRELNKLRLLETDVITLKHVLDHWLTFQRDVQSPNTLP